MADRGPSPRSIVWPVVAAVNVVAFAVQGRHVGERSLLDLAIPTGPDIDDGELWRPLTSLLVHPGGWVHLAVNTVLLIVIGRWAEPELGSRRFLTTYVGAGFATNAVRYALGGRTGGGASGAIFAVAGAAGVHWARRNGRSAGVELVVAVLLGAGAAVAAIASDNHLLALGLGGLLGRSVRDGGDARWATAGLVAGALGVAVLRVLAT